jgi:hypothetical protein
MIPTFITAVEAIEFLTAGLEAELLRADIQERLLVTNCGLATLIEVSIEESEKRQAIYCGED